MTYWDTAEAYGNGLSEDGFGRFFTRYPDTRKDIFLVTKSAPPPPDKLTEALDKGLKRLHTDYVDLFFAHGIGDFKEISEPSRDWAEQMKKAGKMKFFGFSTHTNMEDCLLAAAKSDWIDVGHVHLQFPADAHPENEGGRGRLRRRPASAWWP